MNLVAYLCFFLSGTSSLIFQAEWARMLHHVFGSTSIAISSVVSVFMGGLGLGSWLFGKYADRIKHPLMTYAVAEVGVAICALVIPFLVSNDGFLLQVNSSLREAFGNNTYLFAVVRFLCIVPILLIPTTLMGSTLPLLARHFVQHETRRGQVGAGVGVLYAVNTTGALAGTFLGGFVYLPMVGLATANVLSAGINLGLAALIWVFRRQLLGDTWRPGERIELLPARHDAPPVVPDPKFVAAEKAADDKIIASFDPGTLPTIIRAAIGVLLGAAGMGVAAIALIDSVVARGAGYGAVLAATIGVGGLYLGFPIARQMVLGLGVLAAAEGLLVSLPVLALDDSVVSPPGIAAWALTIGQILAGAALAYLLSRREPALWCEHKRGGPKPFEESKQDEEAAAVPISPLARKIVFAAFALGGVSALGYEVVWSRALAMVIGSSVYSFALILMSFLFGIAGGSAAAAALLRSRLKPLPVLAVGGTIVLAAFIPVLAFSFGEGRPGEIAWIVFAIVTLVTALACVVVVTKRTPVLAVGLTQLLIAASAIVNYLYQDEIPYVFARMVQTVDHLPEHIGLVQFFMFVTAVLCTLPATLGMGVMFPLCVRVWSSGTGKTVGRDIGSLYAANTVGSIVGAWLPGFVLMPTIGMEKTLHLSIALNLLVALALLIASATDEEEEKAAGVEVKKTETPAAGDDNAGPAVAVKASGSAGWQSPRSRGRGSDLSRVLSYQAATVYVLAPLIPAIAAALYYGTTRPTWNLSWDLSKMTLGVFRVSLASDVLDPERWGAPDLVYYHDGLSTTVTVERWGRHYALKNNGKVDASNGDDMPTQIMVAGFPLTLHPSGGRNADVAVIGFGSGVTIGTALQFPIRKVDVIELEPAIMEASQFFRDVNHLTYGLPDFPYVNTPRLNVIADDGRNFLASTRNTYDVIISEPSNPWITGVADLFTMDHFAIAKRRLRQGGIFAQWVQLYEMSPENIKTIYRTFASSFRYVVVFAAEDYSSDTVLLGSDSPIELDLGRVRRSMQPQPVRQIMEAASVFTPHDVFARVLLTSRQEVFRYATYVARRERGVWGEIYSENGSEDCEAPDCMRWPATLNTDDNMHIEFAAPRDLIGFQRYEGYLVQIYSPDWPYGRLDNVIRGVGTGDDAAREYAELAMSLIAHGRKLEAARFVERSSREGRARETAVALEVLRLLLTTENEPRATIEEPVPGPHLEPDMARQLLEGFQRVQEAVDRGAWAQALSAMEDIPAPLRLNSGPSMRFLYGYLLYKAAAGDSSAVRAAIDQLEELLRADEAYVRNHAEVYYFLARAHDAEANSDQALRYMRRFVEARLTRAEQQQSAPPAFAELPEPSIDDAPITDAPGESPKERHRTREAESMRLPDPPPAPTPAAGNPAVPSDPAGAADAGAPSGGSAPQSSADGGPPRDGQTRGGAQSSP